MPGLPVSGNPLVSRCETSLERERTWYARGDDDDVGAGEGFRHAVIFRQEARDFLEVARQLSSRNKCFCDVTSWRMSLGGTHSWGRDM